MAGGGSRGRDADGADRTASVNNSVNLTSDE